MAIGKEKMKMNCFKRMTFALLMVAVAIMSVSCVDVDPPVNDVYEPGPELGSGEWNGIYKWVNPTNKTNNGKCTEIVFEVKEVELGDGELSFEVYDLSNPSSPRRMFPIELEPEGGYQWHDWNENSVIADNYRFNAGKFNTTSITPSKWKVKLLVRDGHTGSCIVESKAGLAVKTENSFKLRYNSSKGRMELAFTMDGSGVASWGLFYNPAPGAEGKKVFPLVKQ